GYTLLYRRAQECPAQRDPIRGPLVGADDGALEIRDQLVDAGRAFRLRSGIRVDQAANEGEALLLNVKRGERQQIHEAQNAVLVVARQSGHRAHELDDLIRRIHSVEPRVLISPGELSIARTCIRFCQVPDTSAEIDGSVRGTTDADTEFVDTPIAATGGPF